MSVRCPLGGFAPCADDACHGVDTTLCGLELGLDFCEHGADPETCEECRAEADWLFDGQGDEPEGAAERAPTGQESREC